MASQITPTTIAMADNAPVSLRPARGESLAAAPPAAMEIKVMAPTDPTANIPRYMAESAAVGMANAGETARM